MMGIPHIGFIVAAYALTALVLVGVAVVIVLDGRALRRALTRMESRNGRRGLP